MTNQERSISSVMELLEHVFEDLQVDISTNQLLTISSIIYNAMNAFTRLYHNLDHVFNFNQIDDPVVSLAAVFHDLVYFQVDKGFSPEIKPIVSEYLERRYNSFRLKDKFLEKESQISILLTLFGFSPKKFIRIENGLNEFLSALVMFHLLGNSIPEKILIQAAVCIEATIPFRGLDAKGKSTYQNLALRLEKISQNDSRKFTALEIESMLVRAVLFANKDVESFADENVYHFIENTWKLLPESNIALRFRGTYTIREYRIALQKMDNFLGNLSPEKIYSQFVGYPNDQILAEMKFQAKNNLSIAASFFQIKIVAVGLLEALADLTGGDTALSLFVGDIPRPGEHFNQLHDLLPIENSIITVDQKNYQIEDLLRKGLPTEGSHTWKGSPLSLYLYKNLSLDQIIFLTKMSDLYFQNKINASKLFLLFPSEVRNPVVKACALMAYTRRDQLLRLVY